MEGRHGDERLAVLHLARRSRLDTGVMERSYSLSALWGPQAMTALSDLIASLIVNPRLPDDILLAVPPRRPGETDTQLRKRTVLITNITALKAREAAR